MGVTDLMSGLAASLGGTGFSVAAAATVLVVAVTAWAMRPAPPPPPGRARPGVQFHSPPSTAKIYVGAVRGALTKLRFPKDPAAALPALEVESREPAHLDRPHLHRFKTLAGWKHESTDHIPVVYPITCQFKMALALMTSKRFPFSVLGTVVNRRCRYELKRRIDFQEKLIHRCKLLPATRPTPAGHLEFDLAMTSVSADRGDEVAATTLTMVLMNPRAPRRRAAAGAPADAAAAGATAAEGAAPQAVDWSLVEEWRLPESVGRQYAALDGDHSPMHLYLWTAKLSGFKKVVANVHLLVARAEATLAGLRGPGTLPAPMVIQTEFKKPTLVPATLRCMAPVNGDMWRDALTPEGFAFCVKGSDGADVLTGRIIRGATAS